ncbi:MAG: hypothetical protein DWQ05_06005 [Calditrichaeota bacterium]|nr:MAG: hypothetical protein DWQ05_06005 [Calditrichota bacterium]
MKRIALFCILLVGITFGQHKHTDKFQQDVATVFGPKDGLPAEIIESIFLTDAGNPVAVAAKAAFIFEDSKWKKFSGDKMKKQDFSKINLPAKAGTIYSMARFSGKQFVGAESGLFYLNENKKWRRVLPADENYSWALSSVRVLTVDSKKRLWFGAKQGIGFLDNEKWHLFTGKEGLPYKNFTSIAAAENGAVWFGTKKGAFKTDGTFFNYRFSRRWLPHDHVNGIVVQADGTAWNATNAGVSRIVRKSLNYEDKAAYFTNQVETRHNRMGFIAQNHLQERYNADSWRYAISDNDGMYTSMYGAAQAFRYAVTGDKEARKLAKRSFEACKWLVDITHEKGFPARVIVPKDWHEPVNEQYDAAYNKKKQEEDPFWKDILPRFVKSKDGKYLWKCDTSSDELAGHYFFYGIYYDLIAESKEEKAAVREVVRDVTDHLIRNGFLLRDHDGKPTRWANFSPEFFNSVWGWDQRGLNSMMMLSFLNVAHHVTGDAKYLETAKMLREKHDYHINAMQSKMFFPPDDVVPWDNNLCLMSMYGLMKYETDPELMMMYRESLENSWLHISKQKSAFWNTLYAALAKKFNKMVDSGIYDSGKYFKKAGTYAQFTAREFYKTDFKVNDIIETLQKLPLDLIGYRMDNRHRLDIVFDPTPGQVVNEGWRPENPERPDNVFEKAQEHQLKVGWHVSGSALPIDERCHVRLDRDGFALDAKEGSGYSEHEGTIYLLPYYMARYHGIIN